MFAFPQNNRAKNELLLRQPPEHVVPLHKPPVKKASHVLKPPLRYMHLTAIESGLAKLTGILQRPKRF